ncbi:MAG: DUF2905 domain-containing protein [Candidatus Omnitrophota bacterium]
MLITLGIILVIIGLLFTFGAKIPHFGRLPGDIFIQRKNVTFYFPITTAILISFLLSLILWVVNRFR